MLNAFSSTLERSSSNRVTTQHGCRLAVQLAQRATRLVPCLSDPTEQRLHGASCKLLSGLCTDLWSGPTCDPFGYGFTDARELCRQTVDDCRCRERPHAGLVLQILQCGEVVPVVALQGFLILLGRGELLQLLRVVGVLHEALTGRCRTRSSGEGHQSSGRTLRPGLRSFSSACTRQRLCCLTGCGNIDCTTDQVLSARRSGGCITRRPDSKVSPKASTNHARPNHLYALLNQLGRAGDDIEEVGTEAGVGQHLLVLLRTLRHHALGDGVAHLGGTLHEWVLD